MTPDRITLRGITVDAIHGVYQQEKHTPQRFVVDVVLAISRDTASDDLGSTVDYAALAVDIAADVSRDPVDLIETLAERIADTCLSRPLVDEVEVTVHKPQAAMPVALDDVAVTITRGRR